VQHSRGLTVDGEDRVATSRQSRCKAVCTANWCAVAVGEETRLGVFKLQRVLGILIRQSRGVVVRIQLERERVESAL